MWILNKIKSGLHVFPIFGCLLLVACTSVPRLNDTSNIPVSDSCAPASYPNDKSLASAQQLELIAKGKEHYRRQEYGLAEQSFRKAAETASFGKSGGSRLAMLEVWLGLAASYDQLKRFDLADPIYEQIKAEYGVSAVYHNNYGYSLELRGEKARARTQFEAAAKLAPDCNTARNNMEALALN